jgi:hypothetical protein
VANKGVGHHSKKKLPIKSVVQSKEADHYGLPLAVINKKLN